MQATAQPGPYLASRKIKHIIHPRACVCGMCVCIEKNHQEKSKIPENLEFSVILFPYNTEHGEPPRPQDRGASSCASNGYTHCSLRLLSSKHKGFKPPPGSANANTSRGGSPRKPGQACGCESSQSHAMKPFVVAQADECSKIWTLCLLQTSRNLGYIS